MVGFGPTDGGSNPPRTTPKSSIQKCTNGDEHISHGDLEESKPKKMGVTSCNNKKR